MKKLLHTAVIIGLGALMFMAPVQSARADDPDENIQAVIELINQIRLDPLTYAEELGYDREALLAELPWLDEYAPGIEAIIESDFLNQKTEAQNDDDPLTEEPVPTLDTDFASTGNVGGLVSFANFMYPEFAIKVVVDSQFSNELDPLYEGVRYILSREYSYVGTAFRGGITLLETGWKNAYFISICFGSSRLTSQIQIVNMINQMRAMPVETKGNLQLDTEFLSGDFQPLFLNDALMSTATTGLYSEIDFSAQAQVFGFSGTGVTESSVIESFAKSDQDSYALWIFYSLIFDELKTYPDKNTIFNPDYNEIGSAVYYVNGEALDSLKLTIASGIVENQDSEFSRIYGVVFIDTDDNGIYTPGEGAPDREISVYNTYSFEKITTVVTNNAGQFSMNLPNNIEYSFQTGTGDDLTEKIINLTSDQYFNLIVN